MRPRWMETTEAQPWRSRPLVAEKGTAPGLQVTETVGQKWEGVGGCFNELGWHALSVLSPSERAKALKSLFDPATGCRLSIGRLPIGASDYAMEWYSHNETDGDFRMKHFSVERDRRYLLPYIKAALGIRADLKLFASPWSPPTWLKDPRAYNYGTLVWDRKHLAAYALYFVKFVQAYARQGVRIEQIHPQNEVVADQKFPSCLWTGAQLRDFIRDYLGPAFARAGLDCEIWLGTLNTDDYNGFPLTVLSDPRANRYVAGVGFQWAGKGAIQRTHAAWPEKRLMQTENECGDGLNTWAYAHYVFGLMQHYITNGANAYVYWNMVLPEGGLSTWGWRQNSMMTVDIKRRQMTYRPEFHVMRHFGQFVEPGAHRMGLGGTWAGNAVAFRNPSGSTVIVMHNPFGGARPVTLSSGAAAWRAELQPMSFNTFVLP